MALENSIPSPAGHVRRRRRKGDIGAGLESALALLQPAVARVGRAQGNRRVLADVAHGFWRTRTIDCLKSEKGRLMPSSPIR
jgi:hypothetical protein